MNQTAYQPSLTPKFSFAIFAMIGVATLFYFFEYFLRVTPSVMKSPLQTTFMLTETAFGYLVAFYFYAYTAMQVPVGILMDKYGPKRILTIACGLCALGTLLFATTSLTLTAHLAQFLIGFGSAFAYVGVLKISDDWLEPKYFALMAGLCTTLGMVGAICGEVISEFFVEMIGWQATLCYAAGFGALLTPLLWCTLRNNRPDHYQPRFFTIKKTKPKSLEGLISIIKSPQLWMLGLIGCLIYLPICVFAGIWAPEFLSAKGFEKASAAFGSSLIFLGFAIGCPMWGYFSDLVKSRRVPLIIGSFFTAICLLVAIWNSEPEPLLTYCMLFLTGFFSGVEIIIFAITNDLVKSSIYATAAAFINMMTMLGATLLPPIIGKLLDQTIADMQTPSNLLENYSFVLTVLPIALFAAGILSIFMKESYPEAESLEMKVPELS